MSNLHRIIWIDEQLKRKRYPGRQEIAQKFEISVRQAARDIEYMKYSLGAPVEYSTVKKGYYYVEGSTFTLPSQYLSEQDRSLLQHLAGQYASYGGGRASEVAALFQRLSYDGPGQAREEFDDLPVLVLTEAAEDSPPSYWQPYHALVHVRGTQELKGLQHPVKRLNLNQYECKFYESGRFLSELLAQNLDFTILSPAWLRKKLCQRITNILEKHS